jgi:hypothetical protein
MWYSPRESTVQDLWELRSSHDDCSLPQPAVVRLTFVKYALERLSLISAHFCGSHSLSTPSFLPKVYHRPENPIRSLISALQP